MLKRTVLVLWTLLLAAPVWALQPPPSGEFVPIDQLPPGDQLPSAPLLVTAYAFVWVALLFYVWTIWRRLNKVEGELQAFEKGRRTGAAR
jgi:CcmD family protein